MENRAWASATASGSLDITQRDPKKNPWARRVQRRSAVESPGCFARCTMFGTGLRVQPSTARYRPLWSLKFSVGQKYHIRQESGMNLAWRASGIVHREIRRGCRAGRRDWSHCHESNEAWNSTICDEATPPSKAHSAGRLASWCGNALVFPLIFRMPDPRFVLVVSGAAFLSIMVHFSCPHLEPQHHIVAVPQSSHRLPIFCIVSILYCDVSLPCRGSLSGRPSDCVLGKCASRYCRSSPTRQTTFLFECNVD